MDKTMLRNHAWIKLKGKETLRCKYNGVNFKMNVKYLKDTITITIKRKYVYKYLAIISNIKKKYASELANKFKDIQLSIFKDDWIKKGTYNITADSYKTKYHIIISDEYIRNYKIENIKPTIHEKPFSNADPAEWEAAMKLTFKKIKVLLVNCLLSELYKYIP